MSEDNDYEGLEEEWSGDEADWCDYGADTECVDPIARDQDCCFGCFIYEEMNREQREAGETAERIQEILELYDHRPSIYLYSGDLVK